MIVLIVKCHNTGVLVALCSLLALTGATHAWPGGADQPAGHDVATAPSPSEAPQASQPAPANPPARTGGSSTDSSTVTAPGKFTPSELKILQRAPYGAKAGKPEDFKAAEPPIYPANTFYLLFLGAGAVSLALTLGISYRLTRVINTDGSRGHAMTLGAKL